MAEERGLKDMNTKAAVLVWRGTHWKRTVNCSRTDTIK